MVVSWPRTTARSWPDPNLNDRWPGVVPRYFPINPNSAATFGTRGAGQEDPDGGKTAVGTGQNLKCPEMGVGKEWSGTGIPANFCDDGAGAGASPIVILRRF